jgi:triphosphoribosyl-dephospho-CoA synthase
MLARVHGVPIPRGALANAVLDACMAELAALKPGNVSAHALSHPMIDKALTVRDFELSAHAIATALTEAPEKTVGQRICDAIAATRKVVDTNTNLGIVLLLAPLVVAAEHRLPHESLREALTKVLAQLSVHDAQLTYEAIRKAEPGGMGEVSNQDVGKGPTITLLQAMQLAAERDAIARAYVDQYKCVFEIGVPALQSGQRDTLATTQCFLSLLAAQPDSLVQRKYGVAVAAELMQRAKNFYEHAKHVNSDESLVAFEGELSTWDKQLKADKINPGTTADFTVACLFVDRVKNLQAWGL